METDAELIQMLELACKDIKTVCETVLHMYKKKLNRAIKDIKKTRSGFLK